MNPITLPGVDQAAAAELHSLIEARVKLRKDFRLALFRTGKAEVRRRRISEAERVARRAAGRRARVARRAAR